ncbi:MAG: PAS domain-containing protein, partial [Aggregatilineales bacterium]
SNMQRTPDFIQPYRKPISERQVDDLLKSLVEQTLPPCIVVDDKKRILHAFGDLNDYLKMPTGIQPSLELDNMIRDELSIPLSTAIYRVMEQGKAVNHADIRVSDHRINLIVKPFWYGRVSKALALIIFSPVTDSPIVPATGEAFDVDSGALQRIRQLEQELQYTKENLQATIEELETSNEELQSTNEELLAANEELQSTNEELHSVNEEMLTVNNEFEEKIRELTALNNDMNNFLSSTEVGTIFLDSKLKLRLFTPSSSAAINLMPQDIGRPLSHLSASLLDVDLVEVAEFTLRHHEIQQRKVQNKEGDWLLLRCLPYHTHTGEVDGAVLTFVDITEIENVQRYLRASEERYRSLISSMTEGIVLQNLDGEIVMCNRSAEQILGLSADQIYGRVSTDPRWRSIREDGTPFPGEDHPAIQTLQTGKPESGVIMGIHKPDGDLTWISINTQPIFQEDERHPYAVVASFLDITELRRAENEIRARERLLVQTQSLARMGSYSFSYPDGRNEWTYETYKILGLEPVLPALSLDEFYHMVYPEDREAVQTHFQAAMEQGSFIRIQYRIIRYDDKQIRYVESIGEPVPGDLPDTRRIIGTLHDITER